MKIGVIQATSCKDRNNDLEKYVKKACHSGDEVINFGVFEDSKVKLSYVQIALAIGLLINSKSVDFIVTGCSSGQGMMLAANAMPNVLCGYIPTPSDAYLFAQINNGNVASFPLHLNWGWAGEVNFEQTMLALFKDPFGQGYPKEEAQRKLKNSQQVRELTELGSKNFITFLDKVDKKLLSPILKYKIVSDYIIKYGKDKKIINKIEDLEKLL